MGFNLGFRSRGLKVCGQVVLAGFGFEGLDYSGSVNL